METRLAMIEQKLTDHICNDAETHKRQEENSDKLWNGMDKIMTNHLPHMSEEIKLIKQDISWIKKIGWFGVTTNIAVWVYLVEQAIKYFLKT